MSLSLKSSKTGSTDMSISGISEQMIMVTRQTHIENVRNQY